MFRQHSQATKIPCRLRHRSSHSRLWPNSRRADGHFSSEIKITKGYCHLCEWVTACTELCCRILSNEALERADLVSRETPFFPQHILQYRPQTRQLGSFIFNCHVFNYICKGLGMQQAWLTAVAPQKNVESPNPSPAQVASRVRVHAPIERLPGSTNTDLRK